jgi:hypothetical protein
MIETITNKRWYVCTTYVLISISLHHLIARMQSLRSLALGVEQLMSGVEEVVSTVGDTLAAVVEDVGDLVFGEEAGEEDYANGAADASGSKKKDEVVVAGGRSQRVKKRLSGTIPGGDGVTLGVGTLSAVAAHSDDEDDEDWNDKLD